MEIISTIVMTFTFHPRVILLGESRSQSLCGGLRGHRNVAFSWTVPEIVLSYSKCTIVSLTFIEPWKVRFVKIDFSLGKIP